MRKKLMGFMLILGCFLLPGSCQMAKPLYNVRAEIGTTRQKMGSGMTAEIYDVMSGRCVMVLPAEEVFGGENQELKSLMQRKAHLRIMLYIR